ncbi:MAG: tRNA preQ1(34) S-adenosylmethionine ribosyltransferase-isomerase QueA [Treponema sp.]|jgi:S-adenosylmethionine:tRNA ribosyltransferase-isomerase|nr:tRNA preQ1(34) S-adenosylmethionine ribosyltransferase-isomerase QueA [Treponema sp.]
METNDFNFDLPEHLVAQYPVHERGQSRLMTLDRVTGERSHTTVAALPEILSSARFLSPEGKKPLLVFNDTKVRRARLAGKNEKTGAETEFLLVEKKNDEGKIWKALAKRAGRKKTGSVYVFFDSEGCRRASAIISGAEEGFLILEFDRAVDDAWLEKYGHIPLPPYIKRKDTPDDARRYQTIYAKHTGSSAAPTAGLHFTREMFDSLAACGIESAFLTLHVGLGTFLPVRSARIEDHVMHKEEFLITEETAALIEKAKREKRKIITVGTTSLRALESAFCEDGIKRGWQSTSIFIYPGYRFKAADALFTNFHTPLSTLLMLVSSFAGRELILESYAEAVREGYRFFSYGDAMLII